jgi:hypothetical protein
MEWNINEPEGMRQAQLWFQNYTAILADGALWLIPRSSSVYRMHTKSKTIELVTGNGDSAMESVAQSLGWSLISQN